MVFTAVGGLFTGKGALLSCKRLGFEFPASALLQRETLGTSFEEPALLLNILDRAFDKFFFYDTLDAILLKIITSSLFVNFPLSSTFCMFNKK